MSVRTLFLDSQYLMFFFELNLFLFQVYRADFRQSMVETCQQNNGEWKFTTGLVLAFIGASIWLYYGLTKLSKMFYFIYNDNERLLKL